MSSSNRMIQIVVLVMLAVVLLFLMVITTILMLRGDVFYKSTLSLLVAILMGLMVGTLFKEKQGLKTETQSLALNQIIPGLKLNIKGGLLGFVVTFVLCYAILIDPTVARSLFSKAADTNPPPVEQVKVAVLKEPLAEPPSETPIEEEKNDSSTDNKEALDSEERQKERLRKYEESIKFGGHKSSGY